VSSKCCFPHSIDNHQVVKLLIEKDANLEMSDLHYGRPLHVAARLDQLKSGKLLLQAGELSIVRFA